MVAAARTSSGGRGPAWDGQRAAHWSRFYVVARAAEDQVFLGAGHGDVEDAHLLGEALPLEAVAGRARREDG